MNYIIINRQLLAAKILFLQIVVKLTRRQIQPKVQTWRLGETGYVPTQSSKEIMPIAKAQL